jgi:hypothetical protein
MGPARYDSDRAMRSQIEDAKEEAKIEAYDAIVNNPDLDLAGGGGEATPTVDPFGIPRAFLNPAFPLEVHPNIPFDIQPSTRTGRYGNPWNNLTSVRGDSIAYDITGAAGIGTDAIISGKGGALLSSPSWNEINAFIRSNGTNVNLYPATGDIANIYVTPSGIIIGTSVATGVGFTSLYTRAPSDTAWTTTTPSSPVGYAYDYQTGNFWYLRDPSGVPELVRMGPSDTTFVSKGSLGLPTGSYTDEGVVGAHGKLAILRGGQYYQKNTNDDGNPTLICSFTSANFVVNKGTRMAPSGQLSYTREDSTTGNVHLRTLNLNGSVTDADLGLDSTLYHPYGGITYLANGKLVLGMSVDDSVFGGSLGERWPAIAVYDGSTTTFVYYDPNSYSDATNPAVFISNPVEVEPNVIRFATAPINSTDQQLRLVNIYELTIT